MALAGEVKYVVINQSTDASVVTAVAGKRIRVLALVLSQGSISDVTIQDDAGTPNVLMGPFASITLKPLNLPFSEAGWGHTAIGQALDLIVSSLTIGLLTYAEA